MTIARKMLFIGIGFCLCLGMITVVFVRADSSRAQTQIYQVCPSIAPTDERRSATAVPETGIGRPKLPPGEAIAKSKLTLEELRALPLEPDRPRKQLPACDANTDNEENPGILVVPAAEPTK